MRIGIFSDTYPPYINGVSTSIVMLKNALEKMGHQVFIVTVNPDKINYKFEDDNKIIRLPGIPTGIYDYRLTGIYPFKAINKIRKWNLDIIHTQTEFGVGTFARVMAKQYDIPLVHTYHTMYEDYTKYITKGFLDKPAKKIVQYLTDFYCDKTVSELIVPTGKTYRLFKNKYKYDRDIHIIPTGIEIEKFYVEKQNQKHLDEIRKKHGFNKKDFIILFIGRIGYEKGIDLLIDAQKNIVKNYPNCKLLIVGSGPDELKLAKLAEKHKIKENVIFTGKVPWEEVPKYYNIADVFATASLTETQGLTVIEALAAGTPVVAIKDDCFLDAVTHDQNGYIFKTKREYHKLIESLLSDKEKLKQLSRQARISSEKFSSVYFGKSVIEVYRKAMKQIDEPKTFLDKVKNIWKRKKS